MALAPLPAEAQGYYENYNPLVNLYVMSLGYVWQGQVVSVDQSGSGLT